MTEFPPVSLEDFVRSLRNRFGHLVNPVHQILDRSHSDQFFLARCTASDVAMMISSLSGLVRAGSGSSTTSTALVGSFIWPRQETKSPAPQTQNGREHATTQ